MTDRLEDLTVDEQVARMKHMSDVIFGIVKAQGGTMLLKESRIQAAQQLKTTLDEVDYGVVYGESTHALSVPNSGVYITAVSQ